MSFLPVFQNFTESFISFSAVPKGGKNATTSAITQDIINKTLGNAW